jgi:hypothetical protein
MEIMFSAANAPLLRVAAQLRLPDILKDGPKSIDDLAQAAGAQPGPLSQVMRTLISLGVFSKTDNGMVASTPLSDALRLDAPNSYRAYAILFGNEYINTMWSNLIHTIRTGESAFEKSHGVSFDKYLASNPDDLADFQEAMASQSQLEAITILNAYDFSIYRTIVDVGGGHGLLLASILDINEDQNGILFDCPAVVAGAREKFAKSEFEGRCTFIGGDFLAEVPNGGDLYVLKRVLVSWDDESATKILANCRAVMADDAKLLVIDPDIQSKHAQLFDICMMATHGGRVRDERELNALFERTGLSITGITNTGLGVRLFEAMPK